MRHWTRVLRPLAFGFGGALVVWAGSLLIPDRYTSWVMIRVNVEPFPATDVINDAYQEAVSRQSLKGTIERLNLYPDERERLPFEDVVEAAKKQDIRLEILPDNILPNQDVHVTFAYRDPGSAQAMASAIMNAMVAAADEHSRREPGWGRLEVKQPASRGEAVSTLAFWQPHRYIAQGMLVVRKMDTYVLDRVAMYIRAERLKQKALSQEQLGSLIASHNLYPSERDRRDLPEVADEMRSHLHIDRKANVLTMKFTYPDARLAQMTLSGLTTHLIDENFGLPECAQTPAASVSAGAASRALSLETKLFQPELDLPELPRPDFGVPLPGEARPVGVPTGGNCRDPHAPKWEGRIDVLDPASFPEEPDGPLRPILAIFGFLLGLGLWTVVKGNPQVA